MAGYFSNHSQSRFLANSNGGQSKDAASATATANAGTTATLAAARPRVPSSKHFSTSVSTSSSGDEKPPSREKLAGGASNGTLTPTVHPLRNTWVFWFRQHRAPGNKITNYEEGIKKISTFSSIESFWSLWTHLNPPSTLQPTTDYLLFHSAIRRPVWEDPLNIQGGKWIVRLKKGVADRLWEDIVMAVVGDQFDDCGHAPGGHVGEGGVDSGTGNGGENGHGGAGAPYASEPEICGCTISVRQSEDILSVWNRDATDVRVNQRIRDTIRRVLNLPPATVMEYKTNNDSMQDKSSFRNSAIDRTPLS